MRQPISFSRDFSRSSRSFPLIKGLMRRFLQAAPRSEATVPLSRQFGVRLSKNEATQTAANYSQNRSRRQEKFRGRRRARSRKPYSEAPAARGAFCLARGAQG